MQPSNPVLTRTVQFGMRTGSEFVHVGMEVCVFLVRSIRRRLVSGFVVAMLLMLFLAGAGILGLVWHGNAVGQFELIVHKSPNRSRLSREISRVAESLFYRMDFSQDGTSDVFADTFRRRIDAASAELSSFRSSVEEFPVSRDLIRNVPHILSRVDSVAEDLRRIASLHADLRRALQAKDEIQLNRIRAEVGSTIGTIQNVIDRLPAYTYEQRQLMTLEKEKERSAKLQKLILAATGTAVAVYTLTIFLGFRWISIPLRNVASGATRIANGDISYRIPAASRWQDEFSDLVDGVNRMADRFQEAEQDLQTRVSERSEQLIRSQKLANVGFLAAGVAHEINNPLSIIRCASESIEMRLHDVLDEGDPEAKEVLARAAMIRAESQRCGEITRRLLDFSRGEQSEKCLDDLIPAIQQVLTMVRHLADFRNRRICFDRSDPLYLEMNVAQIKQVFLNLVANALQATPEGGQITVSVTEKVDYVNVVISDTGCGMDAETLQHIFDPFYTTKEPGSGTGLGLSITHRLIEDHHGTIIPESPGPGLGSSFRIRLPRRQPAVRAA